MTDCAYLFEKPIERSCENCERHFGSLGLSWIILLAFALLGFTLFMMCSGHSVLLSLQKAPRKSLKQIRRNTKRVSSNRQPNSASTSSLVDSQLGHCTRTLAVGKGLGQAGSKETGQSASCDCTGCGEHRYETVRRLAMILIATTGSYCSSIAKCCVRNPD